jgi:hypothetical protein
MFDQIKIQVQDITGNWVTVGSTQNQDQLIKRNLDTIQRTYKRTVRAIDSHGNIVNIQ